MRYANIDGIRFNAEETQESRGSCPGCDSEVVAKRGPKIVHHWAHKALQDCDSWYDSRNMTEWHRSWQDRFLPACQEVTLGEKREHRADVYLEDQKLTVEFQHSSLPQETVLERTEFYTKNNGFIAWVFDAEAKDWGWTEGVLREFTMDGRTLIVFDFSENDCRFRWLGSVYQVSRSLLTEMLAAVGEHSQWITAFDYAFERNPELVRSLADGAVKGPFSTGPHRIAASLEFLMQVLVSVDGPVFVVSPNRDLKAWGVLLETEFPDCTFTYYKGPNRHKLSTRYQLYVIPWNIFVKDMAYEAGSPALPQLLSHVVPSAILYDDGHSLSNPTKHPNIEARRMTRVVKYTYPSPPKFLEVTKE